MGLGVLAELLALLRPAVDSGLESWCVDLGMWEEAFEFCWFGASASQGRLETLESKKAALSRTMVTESRFPFRSTSKVCAWRCSHGCCLVRATGGSLPCGRNLHAL